MLVSPQNSPLRDEVLLLQLLKGYFYFPGWGSVLGLPAEQAGSARKLMSLRAAIKSMTDGKLEKISTISAFGSITLKHFLACLLGAGDLLFMEVPATERRNDLGWTGTRHPPRFMQMCPFLHLSHCEYTHSPRGLYDALGIFKTYLCQETILVSNKAEIWTLWMVYVYIILFCNMNKICRKILSKKCLTSNTMTKPAA